MGLYSPSGSADTNGSNPRDTSSNNSKKGAPQSTPFYTRPSIGLKCWGPFVPAADNRTGLWTLLTIQSAIGVLCFYKFRKLRPTSPQFFTPYGATPIKSTNLASTTTTTLNKNTTLNAKDIADIPTLNIFSTTHKDITTIPPPSPVHRFSQPQGSQNNPLSTTFKPSESSGSSRSSPFLGLKRFLYFFAASVLLMQSSLEFIRLYYFDYDPWYEEAKSARDKKFFNDMVKFYHEGLESKNIQVKDAVSGAVISKVTPEIRQSVALVRAQNEAENPIIKWFGPIEFKPMSFREYLDRLEFYLEMSEAFRRMRTDKDFFAEGKLKDGIDGNGSNEAIRKIAELLNSKGDDSEYKELIRRNSEIRAQTLSAGATIARESADSSEAVLPEGEAPPRMPSMLHARGIVLDPEANNPQDIDLDDIWTLHDPWMNLALDTSLSIKFIPTIMKVGDSSESHD